MSRITVCVPVYNGAAFVAETLESIAAQSFTDFHVLISVDKGDDDSEQQCRRFLADDRFTLITQPARLGWVGNTNALIARVDSPFFCIIPHDDVIAPDYFGALPGVLEGDASVPCAFSVIDPIGQVAPSLQPSSAEAISGASPPANGAASW